MCPTQDPSEFGSDVPIEPINTHFLPSYPVSKAAYELASTHLHPAILNHSVRVYLYAKELAEQSESVYANDLAQHELLFTACILHDIGTCQKYDGEQRFEVEGADAAESFLLNLGASEKSAKEVWTAIALHTSPGIAERISELAQLVREAVLTDFGRAPERLDNAAEMKREIEGKYPRLDAEKVLADAVVAQAVAKPEKAPKASWPNNLYRAYLEDPGWQGVNKGF